MKQANSPTSWPNKLLEWYQLNKRDLPWRHTRDPYHIWVSEIMLQQTQVATVIDYYNRFVNQFPNITTLAQANQESVLKLWEGLGYYSRARNLHKAAQDIVTNRNNVIPATYDELQTLSGLGFYTAAAIASIAFNKPEPVVDGNVIRVFTRFWGIYTDTRQQSLKNTLFNELKPIIKTCTPSEFNQAIMEIGALICTPKKPSCQTCPINADCYANNNNKTTYLPVKSKKRPVPHYTIGVGIIQKDNLFLICKRKETQMLGGLWEFPGGKQHSNETIEETIHREINEETTVIIDTCQHLVSVKHTYSHFKITLHAYICQYKSGTASPISSDDIKWVSLDNLNKYPFPKANQIVIQALNKHLNNVVVTS